MTSRNDFALRPGSGAGSRPEPELPQAGQSWRTGQPFDEGRVSDWDLSLAGEDIFAAAQRAGIKLRGGGTRTGPLDREQLQKLGLLELQDSLDVTTHRNVSFMIYRSPEDVMNQGPSVVFPK
jgi:filamentous hemagglutinin